MKRIDKIFSKNKVVSLDLYLEKVLYDKNFGYYQNKNPFGIRGDYITAPNISNLFCEMIAIWLVSFWEKLKKPKILNFVELGPGNGDFCLILLKTLKNFPEAFGSINIMLYEKSKKLKKIQKKRIPSEKVSWTEDLKKIKKGPIVFFGNEPFSSHLRLSNLDYYRHDWVWEKDNPSGFLLSKKYPLRYFENIMIFAKKTPNYYPQYWYTKPMNAVYRKNKSKVISKTKGEN